MEDETINELNTYGVTVTRLESDMLNVLRGKFQKYSEHILHLLNVELAVKGDSDIVEFMVPGTTIRIMFNPENEGYGLKIQDGKDFAFISPSEMSIEEGSSKSLEEKIMELSESQIRTVLELLKKCSEGLQSFVDRKKEELQEKIQLIEKY